MGDRFLLCNASIRGSANELLAIALLAVSLKKNYERLFDAARVKVRAWGREHVK